MTARQENSLSRLVVVGYTHSYSRRDGGAMKCIVER